MSILRSKQWVDIPTNLSISELMQDNISNTPDNKIIYEDTLNGNAATYGGFREQVRRSAYSLGHIMGFRPGQTASIISPSCVEYIVAAHSVWWAGGIVSTINNSLHPREISAAIDLIQPDVLIVHDSAYESILRSLNFCQKMCSPQIFTLGKPIPQCLPFPVHTPPSDPQPELAPFSLKDKDSRKTCCAILLSSGTTGRPKAVMLSHYNLVAACYQLRADNPDSWRGSQAEIFFPPLSHVYGLYVCITMASWVGAYVCVMSRFDLELYCRLMQDRKATLARLVPPIAKLLAENPLVQKYSYPSLEYFSCSAAPLNAQTAAKLRKAFPGVALCQTYGCTELSGPCVQSGVRDTTLPLSAAGTLIANTEMRFLDLNGADVGAKGPGEITVRGPNVMMGYKDNPQATQESMIDGDWYRTGDLGFIDDKGFLTLYSRIKDVIKYKGFQVSPTELEEILVTHPLVDEAAITGIWSDAEASELPRAYIILKAKFPTTPTTPTTMNAQHVAADISKFVSDRVSTYKRLKGGIVFVDSLPKNATGKVLRRVLRDEREKYEGGSGGKVLAKL